MPENKLPPKYVYLDKFLKVKTKIINHFNKQDKNLEHMHKEIRKNNKKIARLTALLYSMYAIVFAIVFMYIIHGFQK